MTSKTLNYSIPKTKTQLRDIFMDAIFEYNEEAPNREKIDKILGTGSYESEKHIAVINDDNETFINGVLIKDEVFEEEQSIFYVRTKDEHIDYLIDCLSNKNNKDSEYIKSDLLLAVNLNDEYLILNTCDNNIIAPSINLDTWNNACEDILISSYNS